MSAEAPNPAAHRALRFGLVALALAGLASLAVAITPTGILSDHVVLIDPDRTIKTVSLSWLRALRAFAFAAALTCALGGALAWWKRDRVGVAFRMLSADAWSFGGLVRRDAREWAASRPRDTYALGVLMLVAGVIRLPYLVQPIGYDEATTFVFFASRTLLDIVTDYSINNNHIFHNILVHLGSLVFGTSPAAVRLPAFSAGILLVPMAYWLGYRLFTAGAAVWMAALVAASPLLVEYSAQARGYTLLWLFFLVAFVTATYLRERSSISGWLVFSISTILGFYTTPAMLYPAGVMGLWLLLDTPAPRRMAMVRDLVVVTLVVGLATVLLYLPAVIHTGPDQFWRAMYVKPLPFGRWVSRSISRWAAAPTCWLGGGGWPMAVAVAGGLVAALVAMVRGEGRGRSVLVAVLVWMVVVPFAQRVPPPIRVLGFVFPIFAGLAGYGLALVFEKRLTNGRRWATTAWSAIAVLTAAFWGAMQVSAFRAQTAIGPGRASIYYCSEGYFADGEAIVAAVGGQLGPADALVAYGSSGILESTRFYLLRQGRSPALAYPYARSRGLAQLEPFDDLLLVVPKAGPEASTSRSDILATLAVSETEFAATFERVTLVAPYRMSDLYRLEWVDGDTRVPSALVRGRPGILYPGNQGQ